MPIQTKKGGVRGRGPRRGREGGGGRGRGRGREGGGGDKDGVIFAFIWNWSLVGQFALPSSFKNGFPRVRRVRVAGIEEEVFTFSDLLDAAVTKKERMRLANHLNKQSGVKHRLIDPNTGLGVKVNVWNSVQAKNFTPFVYRLSSLESVCKICGLDLPHEWSREDQAASIVKQNMIRYVKKKKFAATAAASRVAAQVAAQAASHAKECAKLAAEHEEAAKARADTAKLAAECEEKAKARPDAGLWGDEDVPMSAAELEAAKRRAKYRAARRAKR